MKSKMETCGVFCSALLIFFAAGGLQRADAQLSKMKYIMDMVHHNPGEGMSTDTKFTDAKWVKSFGVEAMVPAEMIQAAITYEAWDNTLIPAGSDARKWVDNRASVIDAKIAGAKAQGLKVYPFMDIFVVPKTLYDKYTTEITANEKIDIAKTRTKEVLRAMLDGIFKRFPDIDGLVIRTGENYTHDVPYHRGNNPILNGESSHVDLLGVLRQEVCVNRNKKLFYRTWDFDQFHVKPTYYLNVTDKIQVHENLIFSIKHTKGDFHRRYTFNPTLNIGKHSQIVEVQCQREYEGKAAYPDYIARGVIDGFEEYTTMMPTNDIKSLRELASAPGSKLAGVWTWSRGGGWFGPYITRKSEFWADLNTAVMAQWAINPNRSEQDIFNEFALQRMKLGSASLPYFRRLCLLSDSAVLRGRLSAKYEVFNVWWTRDQFISGKGDGQVQSAIDKIRTQGIYDQILQEKAAAANMWREIEYCSRRLKFSSENTLGLSNDSLLEVIQASCEYGRLNYSVFNRAWEAQILKGVSAANSTDRVSKAIVDYDFLWGVWRNLKKERPLSATVYTENGFNISDPKGSVSTGVGSAINSYRTSLDATWPSIPRLYRFVPKPGGWTATWARNRDANFASYRLYIDTVANPVRPVHTVTVAADTSYTFTMLQPDKKYYLRLSAVDTRGLESPFSNEWIDSLDVFATAATNPTGFSGMNRPAETMHFKAFGDGFVLPHEYSGKRFDVRVYDLNGRMLYSLDHYSGSENLQKRFGSATGVHVVKLSVAK